MEDKIKNAVEEYQCPGCSNGCDTSCYQKSDNSVSCKKHHAGTFVSFLGAIFLGMPKGFNRLGTGMGDKPILVIEIFKNFDEAQVSWSYDKWNIPSWKYVKDGHTFVRGLSPRTNRPFLHIFLEDCASKINCFEVSEQMVIDMD
jgi:hypothetical protein